MTSLAKTFSDKQALTIRLLTGLIIGLLIATFESGLDKVPMPAGFSDWHPRLAFGLAVWAPIIWAGVGTMRRASLLLWALVSFVLIFAIIAFEKQTSGVARFVFDGHYLLLFPLLFIGHELVSSGDIAGKWIAPFETYFEEAWKRGVQLALALVFTGLFWGILQLGAALLGFIGSKWFKILLEEAYFSFPVTGLAFGAAVHLGDVQTKLLSNVRALVLGVLSWLLPVITLIGAIFAASLLVSGLAPLWATKAATATLLGGCIGFVLLINAAYQQGDEERTVSVILKWSARGAAILLLIFAVLAAWSLSLRIGQYGLSADRVLAGLGVIIALAFGLGYSAALFVPGRWMAAIEQVNIYLAIFKCVLSIAVLTPIASPDRLSVNDQVARLNAGKVSVANFDWWLLRDETGTYGTKALAKLATSETVAIAKKAKLVIDNKIGDRPFETREGTVGNGRRPATRDDLAALPVVLPVGAKLPKSFVETNFRGPDFQRFGLEDCLGYVVLDPTKTEELLTCKFALLDLSRDGQPEVLLRQSDQITIFTQIGGKWQRGASAYGSEIQRLFDAGKLSATHGRWDDLKIGDRVLSVTGAEFIPEDNLPDVSDVPAASTAPKPPSK